MLRSRFLAGWLVSVAFAGFPISSRAALESLESQHVPEAVSRFHIAPKGRLPAGQRLTLSISLPWQNPAKLSNLLRELYDPASPNFHRFLTPDQFASEFAPTTADYETVVQFALGHGFNLEHRHSNRMVLRLSAPATVVEKAFHVNLMVYRDPSKARDFYAPDREPLCDCPVRILRVGGLENYGAPQPLVHVAPAGAGAGGPQPQTGSATNGAYLGNDFRAAYVPGATLTGAGQALALLEFDGFYTNDVLAYESLAGITNIPVQTILCDSADGSAGGNNVEVALDIEVAMAMAPGLSQIFVYEGRPNSPPEDVLNRIATDNLATQVSSSWGWFSFNPATDQIYQQFAAQGQSMFQASGDMDAYLSFVMPPAGDPYLTSVGGTTLTTDTNGAWTSETVWRVDNSTGSGGGIATNYAIPFWQQGVDMSGNQGSSIHRNLPDVALTADNVFVVCNNGVGLKVGGTSCAAPLWAGLTALMNERASSMGLPPVGFLNPAFYTLAASTNYSACFHDIATGNNTNAFSHGKFVAVTGYDLCTGWGTPAGVSLINALVQVPPQQAPSVITPPQNETVPVGGTASFYVTASGALPMIFQWLWNGTNIAGATNSGLVMTNVQLNQAGHYSVQISNSIGGTNTAAALLTVIPPTPPSILAPPTNQIALIGASASLVANASGQLPLAYRWLFNGTPIPAATNNTLSITNAQLGSAGAYSLFVSNAGGVITSTPAWLTILPGWSASPAPVTNWSSVACSADGSRIVAGSRGGIFMSTNSGVTWSAAGAPSNNWTSVASSADGSRLYAAANRGWIYDSTNGGAAWNRSGSVSNKWSAVACSADGARVVGVIQNGTINDVGLIYYSTNSGNNWQNVWTNSGIGGGRPDWTCVCCSSDASRLVAGSAGGGAFGGTSFGVFRSTNSGASWLATTAPSNTWSALCCSADGTLVLGATSNGVLHISTNAAANWFALNVASNDWTGVACSADGTRIVAVSATGSSLISSDSGATWFNASAQPHAWTAVASSATGLQLVATAARASGPDVIYVWQTAPVLSLAIASSNNAVFSWPIFWAGGVLQQSASLAPGSWISVPAQTFTNAGQIQTILPATTPPAFFRLSYP